MRRPSPRSPRRRLPDGPDPARLTPRLRTFTHQRPRGTDIGDYVRFALVPATQEDAQILAATEKLTDAYWTGTAHSVRRTTLVPLPSSVERREVLPPAAGAGG